MFVLSSNAKGAIAEAEIAVAATKLGVTVLKPMAEHGRYDLVFEIAGRLLRVQCKWGGLDREAGVIKVSVRTSRFTPRGYVRSPYGEHEVDLFAVYCGDLDRCYLLPCALVAGMQAVQLRLTPPRNGQRACITLANDYGFVGAVAQLEERRHGMAEATGSSPVSSIQQPEGPVVHRTGAHQFRNHFGYYLERAAGGDEVHVARRGKPYARLMPAGAP